MPKTTTDRMSRGRGSTVSRSTASAASVAGLLKTGLPDGLGPGATVVCVLTGHGLKDPDLAIGNISVPSVVDLDINAIVAELSL